MIRRWWPLGVLASVLLCGSVLPEAPDPQLFASEHIAFLRLSSVYWQVWIMASDGSSPRQVTRSPVDKVHISPRPATSEILYHTNEGETFLLDLETGRERRILNGVLTRNARFSPNGKRLVYETSPNNELFGESVVWVSDVDGTDLRKVADKILWTAAPVWAGDGILLYTRSTLLPSFEMKHDLWQLNLDSANDQHVIQGDDEPKRFDPVPFTCGAKTLIAYSSLASGFYEIWILDRTGRKPEQLTRLQSYSGKPCWSVDGSSIAFESDASGKLQVYRVGADGGALMQLTKDDAPSRRPVWVPLGWRKGDE